MEDELNIDPRETDYLDDYDMDKATNFFELAKQLADLGFSDPTLVNTLRENVMAAEHAIFTSNCRGQENGNELRTWFEYEQNAKGDSSLGITKSFFPLQIWTSTGSLNRISPAKRRWQFSIKINTRLTISGQYSNR